MSGMVKLVMVIVGPQYVSFLFSYVYIFFGIDAWFYQNVYFPDV